MTPYERKRILRLAANVPRNPRMKPDPEAPEKLARAVTEYGDKRANDAVYHYATQRTWKVRFIAWWERMVSGVNVGAGP